MVLPFPETGLVIRYSYLWRDEANDGQEEGSKDRPCAVILVVANRESGHLVMVAPITHAAPRSGTVAIEMPRKVSRHLGLDDDRTWIIVSEVNTFEWPGPDIRLVDRSDPADGFAYGYLPKRLSLQIIGLMRAELRAGRLSVTHRQP